MPTMASQKKAKTTRRMIGLGIEVRGDDLVMREHRIEEVGEGRNQACPEGVKMEGDLGSRPINFGARSGPGHRRPHSLESVASAGRTLSIASWLSTTDRSTVGSKTGGVGAEVRDSFFPFFFRLGSMAAGIVGVRSG